MAVLAGCYVTPAPILGVNQHLSANLDDLTVSDLPYHAGEQIQDPAHGVYTDQLPVTLNSEIYSACRMKSYLDDFYYRIHIIPNPVDLGAVVSTMTRSIEVWNAYFNTELLSQIIETDTDGLDLTDQPAPPTTFGVLESRIYELAVTPEGNPQIDASFEFDFASENPILLVYGSRAKQMGIKHNWREPVTDRLEWKTDVMTKRDGSEMRVRLRKYPRRVVQFLYTLSGSAKQRFKIELWDAQSRTTIVPMWQDGVSIDLPSIIGESVVRCVTGARGFIETAMMVNGSEREIVEIISAVSDALYLKKPLTKNWPLGSKIYPAPLARLAEDQPAVTHTAEVSEFRVKYEILGESPAHNATPDDEVDVYDYYSETIFKRKPNWREPLDQVFLQEVDRADNQTGVPVFDTRYNRQSINTRELFTRQGVADTRSLISFIDALDGRLRPFWHSTWERDLTVSDAITNVATSIQVVNIGYTATYGEGRNDIMILLKDGTRFYRHVVGVGEVDAYTETVTIDSALGQEVLPSDISMVCFLQRSRLFADVVELVWHTPEIMETALMIKGIPGD